MRFFNNYLFSITFECILQNIFYTKYMKVKTHIAKKNSIECCFHISNRNSLRMIGCKSVTTHKNNTTKIQHVLNIKRDFSAKSKKGDGSKSNFEVWSSNSNCNSSQSKQNKPIQSNQFTNHESQCSQKHAKQKQSRAKQCA